MKKILNIVIIILFLFLIGCTTQSSGNDNNNENNENNIYEDKYIKEELPIETVLVTLYLTDKYNLDDYEKHNIELLVKYQFNKYIDESKFINALLKIKFEFDYSTFTDEIKKSFENVMNNVEDFKNVTIEYNRPYEYQKYVDVKEHIKEFNKIETYEYVIDIQANYNLLYSNLLKKQIYTNFEEFREEVRCSIQKIVDEIQNTTIMGNEYFFNISKVGQFDLLLKKYDENYFKKNNLIISNSVYNTSISLNVSIKDLYIENSIIYIHTLTKYPKHLENTMLYLNFLIDIPKSSEYNYNEIKTLN